MTQLTPGQLLLGRSASLLGITQGIAWFIMSLACIIEYCIDTPPTNAATYLDQFNTRVYYFYLYKDADLPTILTPTIFLVFMCLYVVLTTAWFVGSCFQLNVLRQRTLNVPVVFKDWAIITFLISILDLVLVVLIGVDYNEHCLEAYGEDICINTMIPVLVIAARGFALWVVNVIIAWMLIKNAHFLTQDNALYHKTLGGILPVHKTVGHIPRVNVSSNPSLYSQQLSMVNSEKSFWSVNLRTAMDNRTPPVSPRTPNSRNEFFT